jgi:hypothetical protein
MNNVHHLHRCVAPIPRRDLDAIFEIPGQEDFGPLPSVPDTFFRSVIDGIADLIVTCAERPGHAYALVFFGQFTVIAAAVLWAVLA